MSRNKETDANAAIGAGKPGPGRPKGSVNKVTASAKEAFALAFEGLGGAVALQTWAQNNETEFYKLFARLIPTEQHVSGADGKPVEIRVRFTRDPRAA